MTEHSKLPWKVMDWGPGTITNIYMENDESVKDCTNGHICQIAHCNYKGKPSGDAGKEAQRQQIANAAFIVTACNAHAGLKATIKDHEEAHESHKRLVREIDAILGEPAKQASLCDLVGPIQKLRAKAELFDEIVKRFEQKSAWIKTDMSYKAPEQLKGMALQRWLPMLGDLIDEYVAKAKALTK